MTIVFKGVRTSASRTGGCKACKSRARNGTTRFERTKKFVLPNGCTRIYMAYKPVDVSDAEGEYLLALTYSHGGENHPMFERVD